MPVDVVYVDGSHLAIDVYRDGVLAWPLVVPGGTVILDDYQRQLGPAKDRPGVGIDAFLKTVEGGFEVLFPGHQMIGARLLRGTEKDALAPDSILT